MWLPQWQWQPASEAPTGTQPEAGTQAHWQAPESAAFQWHFRVRVGSGDSESARARGRESLPVTQFGTACVTPVTVTGGHEGRPPVKIIRLGVTSSLNRD